MNEFHDLAEALLNLESGGDTCWGNLGYWAAAGNYPDAARALADKLALAAQLNSDSVILDVGFGAGDQLLHWLRCYQPQDLYGINLSQSQTQLAQQRLAEAGFDKIAWRLMAADVAELAHFAIRQAQPDTIISLDAAYHFPSRAQFIRDAAALLPAGGRLALTDIVRGKERLNLVEKLVLKIMARLSHIPTVNLVTARAYQTEWQSSGFEIDAFEDITAQVFRPFGEWLARYRGGVAKGQGRRSDWFKYTITAKVLAWAQGRDVLHYVICAGSKKATS